MLRFLSLKGKRKNSFRWKTIKGKPNQAQEKNQAGAPPNLVQVGQQNLVTLKRSWKHVLPAEAGWAGFPAKAKWNKLEWHSPGTCKWGGKKWSSEELPSKVWQGEIVGKRQLEDAGLQESTPQRPDSFSSMEFQRMPGLVYPAAEVAALAGRPLITILYLQLFQTLAQTTGVCEGTKTKEASKHHFSVTRVFLVRAGWTGPCILCFPTHSSKWLFPVKKYCETHCEITWKDGNLESARLMYTLGLKITSVCLLRMWFHICKVQTC